MHHRCIPPRGARDPVRRRAASNGGAICGNRPQPHLAHFRCRISDFSPSSPFDRNSFLLTGEERPVRRGVGGRRAGGRGVVRHPRSPFCAGFPRQCRAARLPLISSCFVGFLSPPSGPDLSQFTGSALAFFFGLPPRSFTLTAGLI